MKKIYVNFFKIITILFGILLLTSCASGYNKINPPQVDYHLSKKVDDVTLEYRYGKLTKKYTRKQLLGGVKLVSVKITNNSDKELIYGQNIKLTYAQGKEANIIENKKAFKLIRQQSVPYFLYLLLIPLDFESRDAYGRVTSSVQIGKILGPAISLLNFLTAESANSKMKRELLKNDLEGRSIKAGETVYGIVALKTVEWEELDISVLK